MNRLIVMAIVAVALVGCARQEAPADNNASYVDPGHTEIRAGIPRTYMYKVVDMESRTVCYVARYNGTVAMDCLPYYNEGSTPSGMQVDGE